MWPRNGCLTTLACVAAAVCIGVAVLLGLPDVYRTGGSVTFSGAIQAVDCTKGLSSTRRAAAPPGAASFAAGWEDSFSFSFPGPRLSDQFVSDRADSAGEEL
jgi:hypothetical protein